MRPPNVASSWRGPGAGRPSVPLPPERMPWVVRGRPLKRWTWVGVFGHDMIVSAARVSVAGVPAMWWSYLDQRSAWWAHGDTWVRVSPSTLRLRSRKVRMQVTIAQGVPVEVVSPHGRAYAWTRKTAGGRARGWIEMCGERRPIEGDAIVDESAGYHARHTAWRWSAGAGVARSGAAVAWNLVAGLHDADGASERTVWVDGAAHEVGRAAFADDLGSVTVATATGTSPAAAAARLSCADEHVFRRRRNLLVVRSDLEQRFGAVSGSLPVAGELARAWGVVERHDVRW